MRATYLIHIIAGSAGIISGFIALFVVKGATAHRRAGMVFVYAMLATCIAGLLMATLRGVAPEINVPAALLTGSLVVTSLTTIRPTMPGARWLDHAALAFTLGVAVVSLKFGVEAIANGGKRNGFPAFPFLMFGVVGTLAIIGDIRLLTSGPLQGARRLARHLWRMSFALFIAALSFFIGQAKVFPRPIRIMPLLALPVLVVLVTMLYWLWRVRIRQSLRGLVVRPASS